MFGNQSYRFGPGGALPPAIKNIILANVVIALMFFINGSLANSIIDIFGLKAYDVVFGLRIWQPVTYMFLHDPSSIWHIVFNMVFLWMFGAELEREWGTREFLKYYFITGIGAGIINVLLTLFLTPGLNIPTIGASGAVYGIMLAYALRYPDREILIYFLFPVKIKYFMGFLVLVSFFSTFSPYSSGVAHAAHLGGILVGYAYLKYWHLFYKAKSAFKDIYKKTDKSAKMKYTKGGGDKTAHYRQLIDDLLDKINRVGYLNLTDEEKKQLEEGSRYLREHDDQNLN